MGSTGVVEICAFSSGPSFIPRSDVATSTTLSATPYLQSLTAGQTMASAPVSSASTSSYLDAMSSAAPAAQVTSQATTSSYLDNLGGASAAPASSSSNGFDAYDAQMKAATEARLAAERMATA